MILRIWDTKATVAYLYGFDVDMAILKQEHKQWLNMNVVYPIVSRMVSSDPKDSKASFVIWLYGTTSTTAGHGYNKTLSEKRADAVKDYLTQSLKSFTDRLTIRTKGLSEDLAAVRGMPDETEDPFDRAVIVYVRKVLPAEKLEPPKVRRPVKTFFIRIKEIRVETFDPPLPTPIGGRYDKVNIDFQIVESTARNEIADYTYFSEKVATTMGKSDPYAPEVPDNRDWIGFRTPAHMSNRDFSGLAVWLGPEAVATNTYELRFGGARTKKDEALAKPPFSRGFAKFKFHVKFESLKYTVFPMADAKFLGELKLAK